jgi:NTE family protein
LACCALREAGVSPILRTIGSLVGATYAAGEMDAFESWVLGLGKRKVFGFMDFNLGGGLLKGEKIIEFWRENFVQETVEQLGTPFGCVATDLQTGAEVWLRKGSIAEAVRASIARPAPLMRKGGGWSAAGRWPVSWRPVGAHRARFECRHHARH